MQYVYEGCCGIDSVTRICRLAEYEADPTYKCPTCGRELKQRIFAPRVLGNTKPFEAFRSTVDGSIITSETALREHNKRNNVVNIHDGYDEKAIKNFVNKDFRKPLDEERKRTLKDDAMKAIQKIEQGYKPQITQEDAL